MSSDGSPSIRGLERGIEVLRLLHTHEGTALRALHAATGLPKPTLLRILHTLQRRVLWPSDLLVYRDFAMVLAESSRRLSGLAMNPRYHVGYRVELFLSAPGRAWLAFCTEAEREAAMAHFRDHPPANPRSAAVFRHEIGAILEQTRRQGYAVRDALFGGSEEDVSVFDDGLDAIAVPVPTATGVHAAINLVWPRRYDLRAKVVEAHLGDLQACAAAIAAALASPRRP